MLDLMVSGVESLSVSFLHDVRVFNPGAPSDYPFKSACKKQK